MKSAVNIHILFLRGTDESTAGVFVIKSEHHTILE